MAAGYLLYVEQERVPKEFWDLRPETIQWQRDRLQVLVDGTTRYIPIVYAYEGDITSANDAVQYLADTLEELASASDTERAKKEAHLAAVVCGDRDAPRSKVIERARRLIDYGHWLRDNARWLKVWT